MTTLAAPPLVGERQTSTHDCGPAALAAVLQWTGRTDTEVDIVDWLVANHSDKVGTTPPALAAYCEHHGIPVQWDWGSVPMSEYIPEALARGHVVIGLHQCNGDAEPIPKGTGNDIAHYRDFYGDDAGVYPTMNPWEPELETIAQAVFVASDLKAHVEVMLPIAADNTPTPIPTEDDMAPYIASTGVRPVGETKDPHGDGACYVIYGDAFKRWITNEAELAQYEALYGPVNETKFVKIPFVLDHMVELPPIDVTYPALGWTRSIP